MSGILHNMDQQVYGVFSDDRGGTAEVFWGEIAPCEHLVQIYEDDDIFLDTLEGFVAGGLKAGDSVVLIATEPHRRGIAERLRASHIDLEGAIVSDQYIPLDAEETLSRFIEDGWPNDDKFHEVVCDLLDRGRANGRRVRAFGEMVAVLWGKGHNAATVRLEHLWHRLCRKEAFSLFCAYPKIGFTDYALKSLEDIRDIHSRVIG